MQNATDREQIDDQEFTSRATLDLRLLDLPGQKPLRNAGFVEDVIQMTSYAELNVTLPPVLRPSGALESGLS